jgi:hypothetical protein
LSVEAMAALLWSYEKETKMTHQHS